MATRRMFSLVVCDTDRFLELPVSAQALYFPLGLRADDDGFISGAKKIIRAVGSTEEDFTLLVEKGYIILFDSGVSVITEWKMNNSIRQDRHAPTVYQQEYAELSTLSTGCYVRDNQMSTK